MIYYRTNMKTCPKCGNPFNGVWKCKNCDSTDIYYDSALEAYYCRRCRQRVYENDVWRCPECGCNCTEVPNNGSHCFITTACCEYHGMDDHCPMMETMRDFRDRYMVGDRSSDLTEYYSIAPKIIDGIAARKTEKEEYSAIYGELEGAVSEIHNGNDEGAYNLYKRMIDRLTRKYL